jgi:curved DNA-binding protein CbpA
MTGDPFAVLGLEPGPGLTDDDVRAAWRVIAAATHPDRPDGGDPARFAVAAAAYTQLRTRSGRGEALADLAAASSRRRGRAAAWGRVPASVLSRGPAAVTGDLAGRALRGRPGRLALRLLAAAGAPVAAYTALGWQPAVPAIITGALTWLLVTGRADLAPPAPPAHSPLD